MKKIISLNFSGKGENDQGLSQTTCLHLGALALGLYESITKISSIRGKGAVFRAGERFLEATFLLGP